MEFKWHPEENPPQIEEHSKAKLTVLRSYLSAYFDTLNVNLSREEFRLDLIDGFSGGGTFLDGDQTIPGTPLIMLEEARKAEIRLNQKRIKPLRFNCQYYFIDIKTPHTDHLQRVLVERGYTANRDNIIIRNSPFAGEVDHIIKEIKRRQPLAGRSIFLLDQTGYKHVELALVAKIFRELPAAEVILTFAADSLLNFLSTANYQVLMHPDNPIGLTSAQIDELIENKNAVYGRAFAQRLLRHHIRELTGATYDTPFYIKPRTSRRALWFLHLSRHPKARDVMIQRHWDNSNTFEHYGPGDFGMLGWDALASETLDVFHFEKHDEEQMLNQLMESLPIKLFTLVNKEPHTTIDIMRSRFVNETAARFSDLDNVVIRLFQEKEIEIRDPNGRIRSRFLKRIRPTDRIVVATNLLLPVEGISRRS